MRKGLLLLAAFAVLLPAIGFAQQKAPDIVKHPACPLCGMNRETYAYSRVYVEFADEAAASAFAKANGGGPATFEVAMKTAYEDMYADTKMIRDRRAAKRKAAAEAMNTGGTAPAAKP